MAREAQQHDAEVCHFCSILERYISLMTLPTRPKLFRKLISLRVHSLSSGLLSPPPPVPSLSLSLLPSFFVSVFFLSFPRYFFFRSLSLSSPPFLFRVISSASCHCVFTSPPFFIPSFTLVPLLPPLLFSFLPLALSSLPSISVSLSSASYYFLSPSILPSIPLLARLSLLS